MTDEPKPWVAREAVSSENKRHAPATLRNRDAIAQVLANVLPPSGFVLELASGSGEHICHFAATFPDLRWLPSDPDPAAISSISAWVDEAGLSNLAPPMQIDAATPEAWPIGEADAILCINMVHISHWSATLGLLEGAARLLAEGAPLYLYGPYLQRGVETAPSNVAFDVSLRARESGWGLRWLHDVEDAAEREGFTLERAIDMPANNLSLIFRRGPRSG